MRFCLTALFLLMCSLFLKAQSQAEVETAQKEYTQQMAQLMNCDSLQKILNSQIKSMDSTQLSKEQWVQVKQSVKEQIKGCKEMVAMYGKTSPPLLPNQNHGETESATPNIPGSTTSKIAQFELPSAYKISYVIKDGKDLTSMDLYLSKSDTNYGLVTKDPETGDDFYSVYKEANKMMYLIAKGYIMAYDFGKFQQAGQSLTPSKEELAKYRLKPTGATETIAGYLCKELAGKTDDGSILKVWVSYVIKSGSNVMPGARYLTSEKATYEKFYGSSELGFFLKVSSTDEDGTTTITATKVLPNPPLIKINTAGYQYMDASNMMNINKF